MEHPSQSFPPSYSENAGGVSGIEKGLNISTSIEVILLHPVVLEMKFKRRPGAWSYRSILTNVILSKELSIKADKWKPTSSEFNDIFYCSPISLVFSIMSPADTVSKILSRSPLHYEADISSVFVGLAI